MSENKYVEILFGAWNQTLSHYRKLGTVEGYEQRALIQVDLGMVINEILEAHKPISEHFRFLCAECHRKYDGTKTDKETVDF